MGEDAAVIIMTAAGNKAFAIYQHGGKKKKTFARNTIYSD